MYRAARTRWRPIATLTATAAMVLGAGMTARIVLVRQAAEARRLIGKPLGQDPPRSDRVYKARRGDPIRLVLLGDSIAAGLGAGLPSETLGARLAKGVSRAAGRAVDLRTVAVVGAESSMLAAQLAELPEAEAADVAVIVVGGNDVTHRVPVDTAVRHLGSTIAELQRRGAVVVVGTCPDLGALRSVPQPLRALGAWASRQLATAQREAALALGAYTVDLGAAVGPFFLTDPEEMFSLDRFHPSALGYRRTAAAIVPSVLLALGVAGGAPCGHRAPPA